MRTRCPTLGCTGWGLSLVRLARSGHAGRERTWRPVKTPHQDQVVTLADAYVRHPAVVSKVRR